MFKREKDAVKSVVKKEEYKMLEKEYKHKIKERRTALKKKVAKAKCVFKWEKDAVKSVVKKEEYKKLEKEYKHKIKERRTDSWQNFVTEVGNDEPFGIVYKQAAGKTRPNAAISSLRTANGATMSMQETASVLLNTHVPDDTTLEDRPKLTKIRDSVKTPPDTENSPAFVLGEVKVAVKNFKNHKAPGPDLIEVVVLKKALAIIPSQIVRLLNGCLKYGTFPEVWKEGSLRLVIKGIDKDEMDPKSYRPICLLSVIGKLFEKLLVMRLSSTALAPDRISSRQFGFMQKRSTEDAIVELRQIVTECTSRYLLALLFDVKGAFDNVLHAIILHHLKTSDCPRNIYNVMLSYFENRTVKIAWGDQEISKRATKGCPQGSVIGPPCWNISFDPLLETLAGSAGIQFLAYADDLLVLVKGESKEQLRKKRNGSPV